MTAINSEEIKRAFDKGERERAFWHDHYQEFLERYPNQFLAAKDGNIIAASGDLRELIRTLDALGVPPDEAFLKFMATPDRQYIL